MAWGLLPNSLHGLHPMASVDTLRAGIMKHYRGRHDTVRNRTAAVISAYLTHPPSYIASALSG